MASSASWRAPPTIANLGPGFDVLGVAVSCLDEVLGDVVTATATTAFSGVRLAEIDPNRDSLHLEGNVVEIVGRYVAEKAGYKDGMELKLQKNMRVGTGMGSSASSAVAAAMAVNGALSWPYERMSPVILDAVVAGEAAAIRKPEGHADNVFPALLGGFVSIAKTSEGFFPFRNTPLRSSELYFVVVHPDVVVNTGEARDALSKAPYNIGELVRASQDLMFGNTELVFDYRPIVKPGGQVSDVRKYLQGLRDLISSISAGNVKGLGLAMMSDNIVTQVRAEFIPGYYDVRESALNAGAYGFTIGGSGPTVVSVTDNRDAARRIGEAKQSAFSRYGIESKLYVCVVDTHGAQPVKV